MTVVSAREWTDINGRKMEADFESFDPEKNLVKLRRRGRVYQVPLDQCSEKDVAYVKRRHARMVSSEKGVIAPLKVVMDDIEAITKRDEFLTYLYDRVPVISFGQDKSGRAKLHIIEVKKDEIKWQGNYYVGFRFKMPDWLDGDFKWFHVFDKTEDRKDAFFNYRYNIRQREGTRPRFIKFQTVNVAAFPELKARFPHTNRFLRQSLGRSHFKPGEEYLIWISYPDEDMVNFAFSIGIDSPRGLKECGRFLSEREPKR